MTALNLSVTGASSALSNGWKFIGWKQAKANVRRLQMRIAKATREGRQAKVKALQRLLTHSFHAKVLAVKRVTENRGKRTPGVDGIVCRSHASKMQLALSLKRRGYQAKPLRRIYIPKRNGKQRPLGIPTMKDRAMQALYLFALEPISELQADPNSYGFRPKRCAADAMEQCFRILSHKPSAQWILEGDIKECFDRINHDWMLKHILTDKFILQQWLKSGYIDKRKYYLTRAGTPQGGVASPTLANMVLDGLEKVVKTATKKTDKAHVVRYADDFVITGNSKEILECKILPVVKAFLQAKGLTLSEEKTKITHVDTGFDFLGFNVRKYKGKLFIKPAKSSISALLAETRATIRQYQSDKTEVLVKRLNPLIRGWANYYRHVVSKSIFGYIDNSIYLAIAKYVKDRHPKKNADWWRKHYYRRIGNKHWIFTANTKEKSKAFTKWDLFKCKTLPIIRHRKIPAAATPYHEEWRGYLNNRKPLRQHSTMDTKWIRLAAC